MYKLFRFALDVSQQIIYECFCLLKLFTVSLLMVRVSFLLSPFSFLL